MLVIMIVIVVNNNCQGFSFGEESPYKLVIFSRNHRKLNTEYYMSILKKYG